MMSFQTIRSVIRQHRRGVTVAAIVVFVLLFSGLYILWSVNVWGVHKTSYERWQKDLHTEVDTVLLLPANNQKERSKKMTALQSISSDITSAKKTLCKVNGLVAWQHFITSLKAQEDACGRIVKTAVEFDTKMQLALSYLEGEQALAKTITPLVTSQDKLTEANWEARAASWHTAVGTIQKLPATTAFTPVKDKAVADVKAIDAAWQELIAAHKAKDKAKYTEAQTKLTDTYKALGALATLGTAHFAPLANSLQAAYDEAFLQKNAT